MRFSNAIVALGILGTGAVGSASAADVEAGKTAFKKCALCHTTEAGKNKIGPSLFGVFGRKSADFDEKLSGRAALCAAIEEAAF